MQSIAFNAFTARPRLLALAVSLCFSGAALAGTSEQARIAELEKKLEKSMALIEQLSNRLQQVEAGAAPASASASKAQAAAAEATASARAASETLVAQQARIEQVESNLVQVADTSAKRREMGLPVHGFADVGYAYASKPLDKRKSGFVLGNFDLYLTPDLGDRVKTIIELAFEYDEKGNSVGTDVERLQMGYTFSDELTLWAGRFHTPYGYWNTAFHHGAQISPSIARPRLIAFEDQGGILPSHTVGAMATGTTRIDGGRLNYEAFVGNGSRLAGDTGDKTLDYNAGKDDNNNKAVGANVRYTFGGVLDGVTVGLNALRQQVDEENTANKTRLNMTGAFVAVDRDNWEIISEYYRFRNQDLSGNTGKHSSWAGFAHLGYAINPVWTPFVRLEKAVLDQADNYFLGNINGRSYQRQVFGAKYNLTNTTALKLEMNRTKELQPAGEFQYHEARAQVAIRF
ncbi:DUF3138 family protein [Duganella qianjiadongensis]|uniref:DUF3138 family protein n=1 Tax=Duganella qianjiadongensis TaxID=2692176 RepID=A0ABW9VGJ8_9BURK|nr:DUF3138 family protein [Duganella qianjiadongensis]MYM38749.1 DUF3138 family protein [Duganella qianjiadongensis]